MTLVPAYLLLGGRQTRFWILLCASLLYYFWSGWFDAAVFLAVVGASWLAAFLSQRFKGSGRRWIYFGVALMSLHLFVWKYLEWAVSQIRYVFPGFLGGRAIHLHLPLG